MKIQEKIIKRNNFPKKISKKLRFIVTHIMGLIILNFILISAAEVNFTDSSINWGNGQVDSRADYAILDSESNSVINGSWTPVQGFFVLENIGEENVSLNLKSNIDASDFIGGTNPSFKWKIVDTDSSCVNISNTEFTKVNTTENGARICDVFYNEDSRDEIKIYFKLTIPPDATKIGAQSATITAIISAV